MASEGVIKAPVPEVLRFNAHVPSLSSPGLMTMTRGPAAAPTLDDFTQAKTPGSRERLAKTILHAQQLATGSFTPIYKDGLIATAPEWMIGSGGQGKVYRGLWLNSGEWQPVAVKEIDFDSSNSNEVSFYTERKVLRMLSNTPHVLHILDDATTNEGRKGVLILPLAANGSLANRISRGGYSHLWALSSFTQILQGLASAHTHGIAHRDMKPDNVLIQSDDRTLVVSDWGCACAVGRRELMTCVCGTVTHYPPEVACASADHPYDHKVDSWCAGLVLVELLVGRNAWVHAEMESTPLGEQSLWDRIHILARECYMGDITLQQYRQELSDVLRPTLYRHWHVKGREMCPLVFEEVKELVSLCLTPLPEERPSCEELCEHATRVIETLKAWSGATGFDMDAHAFPLKQTDNTSDAQDSRPVVCLPPHDQIGGWAAYAYDALQPWLAWAYNNNPTSHTHSHTDSSSNTHSHTVNEDQAVAAPANAAERSGRTSLPGCVVRAAGGQQTDRDPAVPAPPSSVMGPHACQCSGGVVLAAGGQPWDSASPSEPHTASAEGVSRPPSVSVLRSGASPSEPHTVPDASARHTESTAAVSRRPGAPSPLKHANVSAAEVMSQPDSAAGISACVGVEAGTGVSECAGTSERHASEAVCTVQASSVCSGVQSVCEDSDKELTTGSLGSLGIFGAEVVAVVGWSDTDLSCALTPRQADNNKGALSAETTQPATAGGWLCWLTGLFAA